MKCPNNGCVANLIELNINSKDYIRGMTHKCMKCRKFFIHYSSGGFLKMTHSQNKFD